MLIPNDKKDAIILIKANSFEKDYEYFVIDITLLKRKLIKKVNTISEKIKNIIELI